MKFREILNEGTEILKSSGIPDAAYDARELLKHIYALDTAELLMELDREVCAGATGGAGPADITYCPGDCYNIIKYRESIEKRAAHVPLQHILGFTYFMGLKIKVTPDVLIPRQDTETLVETVLENEKSVEIAVLDLGTGSGCIACALKKTGGYARVCASDIDEKALRVAAENASANNAGITFYKSDLFLNIPGAFDCIVTNPPYIPSGDIGTLMPEVRDFDPLKALDGGPDGLDIIRRIIMGTKGPGNSILKPGGRLYIETGFDESEAVSEIMVLNGFEGITVKKDLAGLDRVVFGRKKKCLE